MQGLKLSDKHLKVHFVEVTSLCLFEEGGGKWDLNVLDTLKLETSRQSWAKTVWGGRNPVVDEDLDVRS